MEYALTIYSNQDVDARCSVVLVDAGSDTSSAYYPGPTELAVEAPCSVTADYPPYPQGGGVPGFWELTRQDGIPTATYYDPDSNHPLDEVSFSYAEEDCSAYVMDIGGMWYKSALADVL